MSTLSGVEAVLEFPGAGKVVMGEDTQVARAAADAADAPQLFLRLGRVRTEGVGPRFPVMTPSARVIGERTAVFTVRVVLDGSTVVEVERGTVRVTAMAGSGPALVLRRGESARIEIAGTASRTHRAGE